MINTPKRPIPQERKKLEDYLSGHGLRFSFGRELVFQAAIGSHGHFTAEVLVKYFKNKEKRVSRATVYRSLPLLLEAGVIQKSAGEGKRDFYEKTDAKSHHDHMVCLGCKRIIEFHSDALEALQEKLSREYKFKLVFHDHRLFGYCEKCHPLIKRDQKA